MSTEMHISQYDQSKQMPKFTTSQLSSNLKQIPDDANHPDKNRTYSLH